MPKIRCLCVFTCAGTDIIEMDKNHEKSTTRARDLERVAKAEAGEETMVKKSRSTLKIHYCQFQPLDIVFGNGRFGPLDFQSYTCGPCDYFDT